MGYTRSQRMPPVRHKTEARPMAVKVARHRGHRQSNMSERAEARPMAVKVASHRGHRQSNMLSCLTVGCEREDWRDRGAADGSQSGEPPWPSAVEHVSRPWALVDSGPT